ncbi:MAG TPA: type I pantothenate kinase [Candidatus Lumbricidophila sp.]|nr:type I pantothenate kinase [Candidatus Lumbricidophila sp.]
MPSDPQAANLTPFLELSRDNWSALAPNIPSPLRDDEVAALRGLGDELELREVEDVYLPLSHLLNLYVGSTKALNHATSNFLREPLSTTPFLIGIAGSVAVGKSTIARLMRELLARWEHTPSVALVTTDGFLYPNAELERRGILHRKGFPESYDRRALLRFVTDVKSGAAEVRAPKYSHLSYDIVPGDEVVVRRPDVLIVEGLNVLQPSPAANRIAVADLFDFTIYVDARTADIGRWYEERFLKLQQSAFANPDSYFHRYADLSEEQARARAREIWATINRPNLEHNIRPTRSRARLVLQKGADHTVERVLLRKL